ncbi:MAG: methylated-DNA--[protein]-cysteine S-methyltransferase [Pseudomonadota bacterium]
MHSRSLETPLGTLTVTVQNDAITALNWQPGGADTLPLLLEAERQLLAYFDHDLQAFDLPLRPDGDSFQQSVNQAMCNIPFGETREYGEIARDLGSMPQPVGNACGRNTIPIIIPCHRVVGATGLGGFSAPGGVETKVALLKHEGAYGLLL